MMEDLKAQLMEIRRSMSVILKADETDHIQMVKESLMRFPLDVRKEIVNGDSETAPLIFTTTESKNTEILEFLITECGADLEASMWVPHTYSTFEGKEVTLLYMVAVNGDTNLLEVLLKYRKEKFSLIRNVIKPLENAILCGKTETVKCLIENLVDLDGVHSRILLSKVSNSDICDYLISKGLDPNYNYPDKETTLHRAIEFQKVIWLTATNLNTVRLLVESGADVNARNGEGFVPIIAAAVKDDNDVVDYLASVMNNKKEAAISAFELIGANAIDFHMDTEKALDCWTRAMELRYQCVNSPILKPALATLSVYDYAVEPQTIQELQSLNLENEDYMYIQSSLIKERILGKSYRKSLFRLLIFSDSMKKRKRFAQAVRVVNHARQNYLVKDDFVPILVRHMIIYMFSSVFKGVKEESVSVEDAFEILKSVIEEIEDFDREKQLICNKLSSIHNVEDVIGANGEHAYPEERTSDENLEVECGSQKDMTNDIEIDDLTGDTGIDNPSNSFKDEGEGSYEQEQAGKVCVNCELKNHSSRIALPVILEQRLAQAEIEQNKLIYMCVDYIFYLFIISGDNDLNPTIRRFLKYFILKDLRGIDGESVLHIAVQQRKVSDKRVNYKISENIMSKFVSEFVELGASLDSVDDFNNTPLHYALKPSGNLMDPEVIQSFERHGIVSDADPNVQDVVKILIENGAHADYCNINGVNTFDLINDIDIDICPVKQRTLQCLSAHVITNNTMPYRDHMPRHLIEFVERHDNKSSNN